LVQADLAYLPGRILSFGLAVWGLAEAGHPDKAYNVVRGGFRPGVQQSSEYWWWSKLNPDLVADASRACECGSRLWEFQIVSRLSGQSFKANSCANSWASPV